MITVVSINCLSKASPVSPDANVMSKFWTSEVIVARRLIKARFCPGQECIPGETLVLKISIRPHYQDYKSERVTYLH